MRAAVAGNNSELIHWFLQEYGMNPTVDNVSYCMHLQLIVEVYRIVGKNNTSIRNCFSFCTFTVHFIMVYYVWIILFSLEKLYCIQYPQEVTLTCLTCS